MKKTADFHKSCRAGSRSDFLDVLRGAGCGGRDAELRRRRDGSGMGSEGAAKWMAVRRVMYDVCLCACVRVRACVHACERASERARENKREPP